MPINSFTDYPMSWRPVIERKGAIYKKLAQQLEIDIKSGVLRPGTKMPPQRELADFLDINLSTVTKAFKICILKGLLSASVGSGTYVSYDAMANMHLLPDMKSQQIISLGATRPDDNSYGQLRKQLQKMLKEENYAKWFDYADAGEMNWHRQAGALLLKREGYAAPVEDVFLTSGGQNALMAALCSACQYGDKIASDPETYPGLKTATAMLGIKLVPLEHCNGEITEDSLVYACKHDNIKAVYLMPQYQNPTTHNMSEGLRRKIVEIAKKYNLLIIEDGTYNLSVEKKLLPLASLLPQQTFFIAGLSKALSPGLRLAYMAVPKTYHQQVRNALYNMAVNVAPLMSELAARMIVSGDIDITIKQHQQENKRRNALANDILADFTCYGDENCLFRWLLLPGELTGEQMEALALKKGVQVYAAGRFVVGKSIPTRAVRLSICAPQSIEELRQGLVVLRDILKIYM